jgi:hypothetical protein
VLRDKMTIYSHSYLGLGLMAAREAIFSLNQPAYLTDLQSPCMPTPATWSYNARQFNLRPHRPSYETCMIQVSMPNLFHKRTVFHFNPNIFSLV